MNLSGKKLLVLGGTSASFNVVNEAKKLGVHVIIVDREPEDVGVSKKYADEVFRIDTANIPELMRLIRERHIDGVFCGPSEFNIRNMIKLCEASGLHCYTTMDMWNKCANKDVFTEYCRRYDVDVPFEYDIHEGMTEAELDIIDYPIIIKPVDGCSSIGISVCRNRDEVMPAFQKAMDASTCKRIIAEKFIENGGEVFGARYLVQDGDAYPYLLIDTYVADPVTKKSLISAFTYTPSKYSEYYLENMDMKVRAMIKGMGIRHGTVFFQALPYKGRICFHEMGYRLSGGMIFKLTEPLMGINDMRMMIRAALGDAYITSEEASQIDLHCGGRVGAQLMIPLNEGVIGSIEGLEESKTLPTVTDFLQYHDIGSVITKDMIGTLQQHFGRFTIIADCEKEVLETVNKINDILIIIDEKGNRQNCMLFDTKRTIANQGC